MNSYYLSSLELNKKTHISNKSFVWLYFILSPFLTSVFSIFNLRKSWARTGLILFIGFLGFTFNIAEGSDSNRYRDAFLYNASLETSDSNLFNRVLLYGTGSVDFLESLISFIVSRFTNDFRFLFLAYGLIFGFFFVQSIGLLLMYNTTKRLSWHTLIYLICFSFVWGIWDLNVFRFTTASLMFTYGLIPFIYMRSLKNIGWVLLTPLMHFSFFLPIMVLILYQLFRRKLHFCFIVFIIGLLFSEIDFSQIRELSSFLPEAFQDKTSMYANENFADYRIELNESKNWYAQIYQTVLKWVTVCILLVSFYTVSVRKDIPPKYYQYLTFCLFYYGVFSMLSNIPAFSRFLFMGSLFSLGFAFLYFQFASDNLIFPVKVLSGFLFLPIAFFIVVKLRIGSEFISLNTVISNPLTIAFHSDNPSILSIFKK